jgi:hypothetical protein
MPLGAARFGLLGGVADLGKLELIETQTFTTVTEVDFTAIEQSVYNVHFLTCSVEQSGSTTNALMVRIGNAGGIHTTGYQRANQYFAPNGSFGEQKSTSIVNIADFGYTGTGNKNFYMYFYNAGNSSKYTFVTNHTFGKSPSTDFVGYFGGGVYPTAEETTQIRVYVGAGTMTGTISLYGIAES